jgi:hypothetical protein
MTQTTIVTTPVAVDMVRRMLLSSTVGNDLLATAVWEGWPEPDRTELEFRSSGALARYDVQYPAGASHISTMWKN